MKNVPCVLFAASFLATAQEPLKLDGITVTGSLRTRVEVWDWFAGNANNNYAFSGSIFRLRLAKTDKKFGWQLDLAVPILLGLPDDAIAPGAQGQLGFGATYFAANDRSTNAGMAFAQQAFVRFENFKVGRMQWIDGTEVVPKDATLAALKRDRIAHRLIGDFGFTHVGRSFDGVQYSRSGPRSNFTLFAGRPTRGVFQVDGSGELKINVYYGALTRQIGGKRSFGEWRVFGLGYQDLRDGVLKTDNRPQPVRMADAAHIAVGTFGSHFIGAVTTGAGQFDVLGWVAAQTGSWGNQRMRAGAFAAEAGWQPPTPLPWKPWLRGGYDYGSGDRNGADTTHATFFQVLPTPRVYARFPFFNMMNSRDVFGELVLRPAKQVVVRSDIHSLRLANRNDLWYSGGGAYQPWTFGDTGRPSNGQSDLAAVYDVSADFALNAHFTIGTYYGHVCGNPVVQAIYPLGKNANFGYVEMVIGF
jgi:hypothetical protein